MNFQPIKNTKLAFVLCALLTSIFAFSYTSNAATKSVLLSPFTFYVSDQYSSVAKDFASEMSKSFTSVGATVTKIQTKPESSAQASNIISTNNADGLLYGEISQIGTTFLVDATYVSAAGNTIDIDLKYPTAIALADMTKDIALHASGNAQAVQTAQATKTLEPIIEGSISDIQVEGTHTLDPEMVISRMQLTRGDIPTTENIDADIRRIWATGFFDDVKAEMVKKDGADVLVVTVVERPRIDDVVVEGSKAVSLSTVRDAISSRRGSILNDKVLADDIQRVTELYRKKGYYNAEVTYTVNERANGTAALVFNVEEGKKLYVREIDFVGIDGLDRGDLDKYLTIKTRGFFSFLTGAGVLEEENLDRDAQTLAAYAVNQGYIKAQVATPEVIYGDEGITIRYTVNLGPRYALGEIKFAGQLIEDPAVFYNVIKLDDWKEKETYFSLNTLQDDVRSLTTYYQDQGYAFAQVNAQDNVDAENDIINITYFFTQNAKATINHIDIEGNYRTRDHVILREVRLADGDEFSGSRVTRTKERLVKTDYFKSVDVAVQPTEDPALVDLVIKVEENNTGTISVGVGYSTYDGVGVSAAITENNLFGKGYKVGVEGYVSETGMNLSTYFWNPRIYNTNIGAGVMAYGITEEWLDYDKDTIGAQLNFGYPLGEYTYLNWGYRLDQYKLYNISDDAADSIKEYEGYNLASVLVAGITRDTTDATFFPTKGTKVSLDLEYGGSFLGGDDNFIKGLVAMGGYYSLSENHTLHARATIGGVFQNTSNILPAFERFYIGGMNSIRGYEYEDISPRDPSTGESIGADRVSYASLEYIWIFSPELGLAIVPFFDFATAVDSEYDDFFGKQYYSAGLELRWRSPMGDIRFAYGFPLAKNVDGEDRSSGRLEFTMGRAF